MEVEKKIGCRSSVEPYQYYNGKAIDRVIFEKTGLNYLAGICDGDPFLVKFDWESELLVFDSLPGYMTNFGGIHCLFVKELERHPIVVLGIRGKQKSDPDMGYSLFVQNGGTEKGMNLYNFKNEFFQQWTPTRFTFSEVSKKGYIQINVYSTNDHLITKTIVTVNMNLLKTKSSTVPISVLSR